MLADLRIAQIAKKRVYSVEKDDPQPHVDLAFGFLMVNPPPVIVSTKSTSAFFRYWMLIGSTNSLMPRLITSADLRPQTGSASPAR